jgi:HSP20 family protein
MTYRFAVPSRRLGAELDHLFDSVFAHRPGPREGVTGWTPQADVQEHADRYVISLELPGVAPDQVQLVAENGRLVVKGQRVAPTDSGTRLVGERRYGAFERRFRLPESVDAERIAATAAHGVLTLVLPKRERAVARTIEIAQG